MKQVFIGISRNAQFGKKRKNGVTRRGLPGQLDDLPGIEGNIRNPDFGYAERHPDKTMLIEIKKLFYIRRCHRLYYSFST